jgi:hypothetical protein
MRRFGKSVAALTLAAGGALATVLGAAAPANAGGGYDIVLVQKDILSGNTIEVPLFVNISPSLAANLCGVNIDVITALTDDDQRTNCPNQGRNAKVKKH